MSMKLKLWKAVLKALSEMAAIDGFQETFEALGGWDVTEDQGIYILTMRFHVGAKQLTSTRGISLIELECCKTDDHIRFLVGSIIAGMVDLEPLTPAPDRAEEK